MSIWVKNVGAPTDLADIRDQIDELDGELRDLLLARAQLVDQVAKAKAASGDTVTLRPQREAAQIAKLAEWQKTNAPDMSLAGLVAIWREIIGMALYQQGGLEVVCTADGAASARAHFGASVSYRVVTDAAQALAGVSENSVAVIALPQAQAAYDTMQVVARLPATGPAQALCYGVGVDEGTEEQVTLVRSAQPLGTGKELYRADDMVLSEIDSALTGAQIADQFADKAIWLGTYRRPISNQGEQ